MWSLLAQTSASTSADTVSILTQAGPWAVTVVLLAVVRYLVAKLDQSRQREEQLVERLLESMPLLAEAAKLLAAAKDKS